jgi:type VI secretion system protein ImpC
MPASAEIDIGLETRKKATPAGTLEDPFRIALLGDFSGHASRGVTRGPGAPIPVDSVNLEEVMEMLQVSIRLTMDETPIDISFRSLDDFHPDALQERLPVFQAFARLRDRLADPATFAAAAEFLGGRRPGEEAGAGSSAVRRPVESGAVAAQPARDPAADWDDFIQRSVAAHLKPGSEPGPAEWTAATDAAIGALMRSCLASPAFQSAESAWRSVLFLLERLEAREDLQIELIDVAKPDLVDLAPAGWSVAACLHRFEPEAQDCRLLAFLAAMGRRAGGPVLAEIGVRLAGCESIKDVPNPDHWRSPLEETAASAWHWLRADPDARWLGVAVPRFLLRLPYGRDTGEITSLAFEEMPSPPVHEAYLWGSPAVACACALGQSYARYGWKMRPGQVRRLEGLPVHNYRCDDEICMTPPAEVWLTEYRAERILADGAMPLISPRASDSLRILLFQSVADPPAPLAGPWESGL